MSALAVEAQPLYWSPWGLLPFQGTFAAYCSLRRNNLVNADTGLGKTHIGLAAAAVLLEDDKVDHVVYVVERNKVDEWAADIKEFTRFDFCRYTGTRDRRARLRKALPRVILTTYGVARSDLAIFPSADKRKTPSAGPFLDSLRGKRVMFILDEFAILGSRTSQYHRSIELAVRTVRKTGECWVVGMTGTPMTSSPENYYDLGRILCPDAVGTVEQFHRDHVVDFDEFNRPRNFKNLDLLAEKMSGVLLRKRKTDHDVVDYFPETVERFSKVELDPAHREAYDILATMVDELPESRQRFTFNVLTQFACHPRAILGTTSEFAQEFIGRIGVDAIKALVSAKTQALLPYLHEILSQGDGVLIFCRLTSVLDELSADLAGAGIGHTMYTGQMSDSQRERAKALFRSGDVKVLLASAAAERGINLPEATYIVNFDVPLTHSSYIQRSARGSRLDAERTERSILVVKTLIADATADAGSMALWKKRNYQTDVLTNSDVSDTDEHFVPSAERFRAVNIHRRPKSKGAGENGEQGRSTVGVDRNPGLRRGIQRR